MSLKYKLGVFVEAGGNKVFFANGVLGVLNKEGINIDKIVGFSSSGPIILAYLLNKNEEALEIFAKRLEANKNNFYLFNKDHFPHNNIYRNSIEDLLGNDYKEKIKSVFIIFASSSNSSFVRIKSLFVSLFLYLDELGINFLKKLRMLLNIIKVKRGNESLDDKEKLINFMMGSSTLYPFIKPQVIDSNLIMEGALLKLDSNQELLDCERKIIIHTKYGISQIIDDTLHIYIEENIPINILDYTNGKNIRDLNKIGEEVMKKNIIKLKDFIK